MRVTAARFWSAAATAGGEPASGPPEVAFAGRSNVGKSSLLNCVVGRKSLARISRTPGRTRQLNFFLINERLALVDLPGYGFAVGPEAERRGWGPLVEHYLHGRDTLCGVLVLLDLRRGLQEDDAQLLGFLRTLGRPCAVVATKMDQLRAGARRTALAGVRAQVAAEVPVLGFSAHTGEGRIEVWKLIEAWAGIAPRARP